MCLKGKEWSPLEGCLEAGDPSSQAPGELRHHWSLGQAPHQGSSGLLPVLVPGSAEVIAPGVAAIHAPNWQAGGEHIQRGLKSQPR